MTQPGGPAGLPDVRRFQTTAAALGQFLSTCSRFAKTRSDEETRQKRLLLDFWLLSKRAGRSASCIHRCRGLCCETQDVSATERETPPYLPSPSRLPDRVAALSSSALRLSIQPISGLPNASSELDTPAPALLSQRDQ